MSELFDMRLRALRRDRAARAGPELFLFERVFDDCLERIALVGRTFDRAMLIGCPDARWPNLLRAHAPDVDVCDPGPLFAAAAGGKTIVENRWEPPSNDFDLVVAIGTLDTVNSLPLALRLIRQSMRADGHFVGAISGGDTLPQLRRAMRAADQTMGGASPHVHPRIEASALAPLLSEAGLVRPVVDVERVQVAYSSFERLVSDLRGMAATNVLASRSRPLTRAARSAAIEAFTGAAASGRTPEIFEILHFAAWTPAQG